MAKHRSNNHEEALEKERSYKWKIQCFNLILDLLHENQKLHHLFFHLLSLIENLQLLWFILHPTLHWLDNLYLIPQARSILRGLNFQEYISSQPQIYKILVMSLVSFHLMMVMMLFAYTNSSKMNEEVTIFQNYLRKVLNITILISMKVLTLPLIGLASIVLYCDPTSIYHQGQVCYDSTHLIYCVLVALLLVKILVDNIIHALFYYYKNPFNSHFMAEPNKLHHLAKTVIKLILPIYFIIDVQQNLIVIYLVAIIVLWVGYLFYLRLFALRHNNSHFYIEVSMEIFLTWQTINNVMAYYLQDPNQPELNVFIYSLICSVIVALVFIHVQIAMEKHIIEECLDGPIKTPIISRFVYIFIAKFINSKEEGSNQFEVFAQIMKEKLLKNAEQIESVEAIQAKESIKRFLTSEQSYKSLKRQEFKMMFFEELLEIFLKENRTAIIKAVRCFTLAKIGKISYAIHETLELEEEKLTLSEELMLYGFRKQQNVFEINLTKENQGNIMKNFSKYFVFTEKLILFQQLIQQCSFNNKDYWQQLCENDSSIVKIKNLAKNYDSCMKKIRQIYEDISQIFAYHQYSSRLYFQFLLQVGIDIKQALLIKNKLQMVQEINYKNKLQLSGEDQEENIFYNEKQKLGVITLDTVGNNLGIILNCNTQMKEFINYDIHELKGKSISKIQPKIIANIHNKLLQHFLKEKDSHKKMVQKIVPILTKELYLIEAILQVKVITNSLNSMHFVGFLKLKKKQQNQALLMVEMNTMIFHGANQQFYKMLDSKSHQKQLTAEEVKITVFMPEINLIQLEHSKSQLTVLDLSIFNQDQESSGGPLTKAVKVEISALNCRDGLKIATLKIKLIDEPIQNQLSLQVIEASKTQLHNEQLSTEKRNVKFSNQTQLFISNEFKDSKNSLTKNAILSQQKTNLNQKIMNERVLKSIQVDLNKELAISRRIQDYVDQNAAKNTFLLIKLSQIISVLVIVGVAIYFHLTFLTQTATVTDSYNQINAISNILYDETELTLQIKKLKLFYQNQTFYAKFQTELASRLQELQRNTKFLSQNTNKYSTDLEFNTNHRYNFTYFSLKNNVLINSTIIQSSNDALSQFTSTLGKLLISYNTFVAKYPFFLKQQLLYLQNMGMNDLPNITINTTAKINAFFDGQLTNFIQQSYMTKIILLSVSMVCILLIFILINQTNSINFKVIKMYNKIKLWDVNQLILKCNKFLEVNHHGNKNIKRRSSNILKIFPLEKIVKIIEDQKKRQNQKKQNFRTTMKQLLLGQDQIREPSNKTSTKYQEQIENLQNSENSDPEEIKESNQDQKLLKSPKMVNLQIQSSSKKVIRIGFLAIFLMLLFSGFITLINSDVKVLKQKIENLKIINSFQKSIVFINFYSFTILTSNSSIGAVYLPLLRNEINIFYENSGQSYTLIGDPHPILKEIYISVSLLEQNLFSSQLNSTAFLSEKYPTIDESLGKNREAVVNLDLTVFNPTFTSLLDSTNSHELLFTILFALTFVGLILTLHWMFVSEIEQQIQMSLCMIKILPPWMIHRTKYIKKQIQRN